MSQAQSQYSVSKLYQSVIDDVMSGIREAFLDEGVDEQVLQELRMLWESKLVASKAVDNPDSFVSSNSTSTTTGVNSSNGNAIQSSNSAPIGTSSGNQSLIATESNALVPIQITMPRQSTDPPGMHRTITIQVPASSIHSQKLQEVLSLQTIQATLSMPSDIAASTLQSQVNQALRELGETTSTPASVITSQQQLHQKPQSVLQLDGAAAGDSSDEDDCDDDSSSAEEVDDDDVGENDDEREDEQEEEGQDEEPLNSEDDVSEAGDDNERLYEIDNVVVCQYDKITRTRNKWKFHLKDGIMNLNGKDYVFQKANGDAEW